MAINGEEVVPRPATNADQAMLSRSLLKVLALLPLLLVVLLVVWAGRRGPLDPPPPGGEAGRNASVGAVASLPAEIEGGWKVAGEVQRFDSKTLFDRINGAAPPYIQAGFRHSFGAEFRKPTLEEPVTVDVYDMGQPAQAFGIYARERDPSYRFIDLEGRAQGYLAAGSLNFWYGRFYVKLAAFDQGEAVDRELRELAEGLAAVLPAAPAAAVERVRALTTALPQQGRKEHTEGYSLPPLRGVAGLQGAFFAHYHAEPGKPDAPTYELFLVPVDAPDELTRRGRAFEDHFANLDARLDRATLSASGTTVRILTATSKQGRISFVITGPDAIAGGLDLPVAALAAKARDELVASLLAPGGAQSQPARPAQQP